MQPPNKAGFIECLPPGLKRPGLPPCAASGTMGDPPDLCPQGTTEIVNCEPRAAVLQLGRCVRVNFAVQKDFFEFGFLPSHIAGSLNIRI